MSNQASNVRENGFETLIVQSLVSNAGYEQGNMAEYNRDYCENTAV